MLRTQPDSRTKRTMSEAGVSGRNRPQPAVTTAARHGSVAHDEIEVTPTGVARRTNRAGGIEGGMSTGEVIRLRVAMKPISTVPRALSTVDVLTGEPAKEINQRSDVTAVTAAGVVAEAMVALVLAEAAVEKFGGDSMLETKRNFNAYLEQVKSF